MLLSFLRSLFLVLVFSHCSILGVLQDRVPKPEITFSDLRILQLTLQAITLEITTTVENPYPLSLPKSILEFGITIEKNNLSQIKTDLGQIKAKETRKLPFQVKINYLDLYKIYKAIPGKALLDVGVDGKLTIPLPETITKLGQDSLTIPFQKSREIPAVLPDVNIENFRMEMPSKEEVASTTNTEALATAAWSFLDNMLNKKTKTEAAKSAAQAGLAQVDLDLKTFFTMKFSNQAAAALKFQDLNYNLNLAGESFLNGQPKEIVNLGKESVVKVETKFPVSTISQGIYKTIQNRSADYQLLGDSKLGVPGLSEILPFGYEKKGKFQW